MSQIAIVTDGTTGLTDGTLVDESNRIVFTGTDPIEVHARCASGYWSADQAFYVPEGSEAAIPLEVSFDDGGTWEAWGDTPVCPEIEDVNFPVLLRQTEAIVGTLDTDFRTDGSYTAIAALSTPTLTVTPSDGQNALSWTNVSNEDGYVVEWSANGSTGWTALTTTAANATSYTDTGLTNGVARYYRVKATGSGRYSDSGWGTGNGTPFSNVVGADDFTGSDNTNLESHTPSGTGATGSWAQVYGGADKARIKGNKLGIYRASSGGATAEYEYSVTPNANCAAECDVYVASIVADSLVLLRVRSTGYNATNYAGYLYYSGGVWTFYLRRWGQAPITTTISAPSVGSTHKLKLEAIGSAIKLYWDGVEKLSLTDSVITAAGKTSIQLSCGTAVPTADAGLMADNFKLLNA